jgi:hypothetical protein
MAFLENSNEHKHIERGQTQKQHTFVPDHPNRKAISCAKSSPKPSISPLTNGRNKLIAAPLTKPHIVGGEYNISGELDGGDDVGGSESSLLAS